MKKHKRIKALPVCSETLREKCAIIQNCVTSKCKKEMNCAALELIDRHFAENGIHKITTAINCRCAENMYSGLGCPYFRKAVDK